MEILRERLITVGLIVVIVFSVGIIGYTVIERWNFFDALYMTVITLATVGYGETHPLSQSGRIFTIFLILMGMSTFFYGLSTITAFVVEGELKDILGKRKMEKEIKKLNNHIIICGLGKTGKPIMEEMIKTKNDFVIVEMNKERIEHILKTEKFLYIIGDSTESEVLLEANIKNARGLITTLPSDKDNLYVILTARELNPNLRIVTRAIEVESRPKLLKAGANAIVSTNLIGGMRMASEMIRPTVVSFLDIMLRDPEHTMRVEEIQITSGSSLIGKIIKESKIFEKTGLLIIALKSTCDGKFIFNPSGTIKICENDVLIVCGNITQIGELKEIVK